MVCDALYEPTKCNVVNCITCNVICITEKTKFISTANQII